MAQPKTLEIVLPNPPRVGAFVSTVRTRGLWERLTDVTAWRWRPLERRSHELWKVDAILPGGAVRIKFVSGLTVAFSR